jgi:hypothetical protein
MYVWTYLQRSLHRPPRAVRFVHPLDKSACTEMRDTYAWYSREFCTFVQNSREYHTAVDAVLMQCLRGFGTVEICDILHINNNLHLSHNIVVATKNSSDRQCIIPLFSTPILFHSSSSSIFFHLFILVLLPRPSFLYIHLIGTTYSLPFIFLFTRFQI